MRRSSYRSHSTTSLPSCVALTHAAWITVGVHFIVRVLTIRFNEQTRSVWEEDTKSTKRDSA